MFQEKRAATWLLLICSLWVPGRAMAQQAAAPGQPEAAAQAGSQPVPAETGPRAAVQAFFAAMNEGDTERATTTFEPDVFETHAEALEAARMLYEGVFLKTRRISVGTEVPRDIPGTSYLLSTYPEGRPDLRVDLELERSEGGFRFSRGTLVGLPDLVERLADVGLSESVLAEFSAQKGLSHRLRSALPPALLERSFLIENWQWLGLLALVLVSVLMDRLVRILTGRLAVRFVKKRGIRVHEEVLVSLGRPLGLFFAAITFELLLPVLGFEAAVFSVLNLAAGFIAAAAGVWTAYRLVDVFCDFLAEKASGTSNKFDDMLVPLARRTFKIFVVVVGLVFVSSHLSDDLWGVVAGLGLGSIAVGFAARDSIENLFGTFTVLLDKPFQIGDWVITGDLEGTVETVGFRSTRIRTFYNSLITVPNREFIASAVDNMGERVYRRIRTTLGVTYDTPPEKIEAFCEGIREILRLHPYTRKDYYHVYLNGFGASSLEIMLYCFVETPDWATELREKHRLFADILRLAERLGVSFAFPTQTLHVAKPEDMQHDNRPANDVEGARLGLQLAGEVVAGSLAAQGGAGGKPPPVRILTRSPYGSDGGDGG